MMARFWMVYPGDVSRYDSFLAAEEDARRRARDVGGGEWYVMEAKSVSAVGPNGLSSRLMHGKPTGYRKP